MRKYDFFQAAFTKCVHIRLYKVQSPTRGHKNKIYLYGDLPQKLTLAHYVIEVTELCRTRADILTHLLPEILPKTRILKLVEWFSGHCRAIKSKSLPQTRFRACAESKISR